MIMFRLFVSILASGYFVSADLAYCQNAASNLVLDGFCFTWDQSSGDVDFDGGRAACAGLGGWMAAVPNATLAAAVVTAYHSWAGAPAHLRVALRQDAAAVSEDTGWKWTMGDGSEVVAVAADTAWDASYSEPNDDPAGSEGHTQDYAFLADGNPNGFGDKNNAQLAPPLCQWALEPQDVCPAGFLEAAEVPRNCDDVKRLNPGAASGVYVVQLCDLASPCCVNVFCDMYTTGGGWTMIQRRFDGSVSWVRNWTEYEDGFGNLDGEHWLGLRNILYLTQQDGEWDLMIELKEERNCTLYETYKNFYLLNGTIDQYGFEQNYYIKLGARSNTEYAMGHFSMANLMSHRNRNFSTKYRDTSGNLDAATGLRSNGAPAGTCAWKGDGWWFYQCTAVMLNSRDWTPSGCGSNYGGNYWRPARGSSYMFGWTQMKVRPATSTLKDMNVNHFCTNFTHEPCALDCQWTAWGAWGDCLASTRTRLRNTSYTSDAVRCPPPGGAASESMPCNETGNAIS